MENILFVNSIQGTGGADQFSLGQLSLATILKNEGYNVNLIDFDYLYNKNKLVEKENSIEEMVDYILNFNPNLVGFYTMCNSYHISLEIAKQLKEKKESIKIVFGGPHASLTGVESMKKFSYIDVIAVGESEKTIVPIVKALFSNSNFENIEGVIYRKDNEIVHNKQTNLIKDLDSLPFLDFSLIPIEDIKVMPLDVGRGCPFGCTYCSTKTFWKRFFRLKSPKRIVEEIKYINLKYGIKEFSFVHDLFTANKTKLSEFCELILLEKIKINWSCSARLDTLNEELIKKMYESGCKSIYLGIETGSPRMQKIINKNLNLSCLEEKIKILKKYKINITTSFIYGFPEETLDDIDKTLSAINEVRKLEVKNVQLHLLSILPGTELFEKLKDNLMLASAFSDITGVKELGKDYREIITENPMIFPQYFDFYSDIRENLKYLDKFINIYHVMLFKHLPKTYEFIMKYYNDSILKLFIEFKDINANSLENLYDNGNWPIQKFVDKNKLIINYINNCNFGKYTNFIREMVKFETNIVEFMYFDDKEEIILDYNFDVFNAKKSQLSTYVKEPEPIKIMFTRVKEKNIKVKKIS
ncbi:hypothetical protein UT300019_02740 [Clostridium sp. CTA-19]